jgi:hypothetical protein
MKRLFSYSLVVILGFVFAMPISSSLAAGTLKVTSPNGGQKWKTGKKYAIKWVKGNAGSTVKIQLLKSDKHYKWVSKKTKNDGKHPWKVPATVATGSAYKIKIVSTKNKKVFDKSNKNFTITKTGGGGTSSIRVTTPNGGQKWKTGKRYAIKWVKGNAGSTVKIQLLKSGKHYKWISKKTNNDGKHPWKVPASVVTSSAYKIKIVSTKNKKVFDKSNKNFTITKTGGGGAATFKGKVTTFTGADSLITIECTTCSSSNLQEVNLGDTFSIGVDTGDHIIKFTSSGSTSMFDKITDFWFPTAYALDSLSATYSLDDVIAGDTLEWNQIQIKSSTVSTEHTGTWKGEFVENDGEIKDDLTLTINVGGNSMTGTVGGFSDGTVSFSGTETGDAFNLTWTQENSDCAGIASGTFSGNTFTATATATSGTDCEGGTLSATKL